MYTIKDNKSRQVTGIYAVKDSAVRTITQVYTIVKNTAVLVWSLSQDLIYSVFGAGYWMNNEGWDNNDSWKNN